LSGQSTLTDKIENIEHKIEKEITKDTITLKHKILKNKVLLCLMIGVFILGLFLNYMYTREMNSLPSPIYGGDYYFQMGSVNHILSGGNPFHSSTSNGEIAVYQPLYSILTAGFAKVFGLDAFAAMNFMSYIIIALGMTVAFYLLYKLFDDYYIAIFGSAIFTVLTGLPVYKYLSFGMILIVPLFLLCLYRFVFHKSIMNGILLGLMYGITGITHSIIFISSTFFLILTFLYYELYQNIYKNFRKNSAESNPGKRFFSSINIDNLLDYAIVAIMGTIVALLWWYAPLFVFHGKANMFIGYEYTFKYQMALLWMFIKQNFFHGFTLKGIVLSLFSLLGLFGAFFLKNKKEETKFAIFLFTCYSIIVLHFLVTQNFFGINFVADYLMITFYFVQAIFVCYGVKVFGAMLGGFLGRNLNRKIIDYIGIIVMLLGFLLLYQAFDVYTANKWYESGKAPFGENYVSLQEYLLENSEVTDTIITPKELGFAVNSMTGRKIVASRRGHAGQFQYIQSDIREKDLAIMLYGQNLEKKIDLLKKYDVKYLYWDYYWINSEFQLDGQGRVVGLFDPLLMVYDVNIELALQENNVSYAIENGWLDPSVRGPDVMQHRLIIASPQNYQSVMHPWNPSIDPILSKVWSYSSNGQELAALYEVRIPQ